MQAFVLIACGAAAFCIAAPIIGLLRRWQDIHGRNVRIVRRGRML